MKKASYYFWATTILLLSTNFSHSQGIVDGFFSEKASLSLTASYLYSSYEDFYVGETSTSPVPAHTEIDQNIFTLYGKYGITNDFTVVANVPYISAEGNGMPDPVNGETEISGFQDISLLGKYRPHRLSVGEGHLDFITALGFTIPTGYENNGILSLGTGSFTVDPYLGLHLMADMGLFTTLTGGYSFRGNAENKLEVGNGGDFDVPNALLLSAKLGYATNFLYVETWMDHQSSSDDGIDIMGPGFAGNFPETRVDYTRIGITVYAPITQLLGLSAGYGNTVDGRNIGDPNYFYTGLTFSFNNSNPSNTQSITQ